jgi:hypothetical protein
MRVILLLVVLFTFSNTIGEIFRAAKTLDQKASYVLTVVNK